MTKQTIRLTVALAAAFFACNVGAAGFFPLGDLIGGDVDSRALGISADGSTVVGESNSTSGREAFIWTSGAMVGLGFVPGGSAPSFATGTSGDGSTVVGQSAGGSDFEAFTWTSGSMVSLGHIVGGSLPSKANAVSSDGLTVVGGSVSASGPEAFIWTGSSMVGLGDFVGGAHDSIATGVSADGATVVGAGVTASGSEAFIWTSGGSGLVGLGDLAGGFDYSRANGVSADGTTVVGTSSSTLALFEAFVWTSGSMQPLGVLNTHVQSDAFAVSGDGSAVVGASRSGTGVAEAFIWTSGGGMQSVKGLATASGITGLTNWTLLEANGISADGASVVGAGKNSGGDDEAWMITFPDTDGDGRPDYIDNCPNVQNTAAFPDSEGWDPQQDDDSDDIGNACDLVIPPQFVPNAKLGNTNYSHQLTALRCQQPCTWEMISGFLPNALTFDSFGVISGAVRAGGFIANFTVKVTDSTNDTATRIMKIKAKIPGCYSCHEAARF